MKEFSIEGKAQAYDVNYKSYTELVNRLEDAKGAIKKQNYGIAMDILCKPYPEFQITTSTELAESDDDEIRKSLFEYFKNRKADGDEDETWYGISYDEILAWFERQGKHTTSCSDEQMKVLNEVLNFAANHESPYWNDYIFGTLSNLIRQLKKLRG